MRVRSLALPTSLLVMGQAATWLNVSKCTMRARRNAAPARAGGSVLMRMQATVPVCRYSALVAVVSTTLCLVTMIAGYAFKARCFGPTFDVNGVTQQDLFAGWTRGGCYTDIQALWSGREMFEHRAPYTGTFTETGGLVGGTLEYPVLSGVLIWLVALPSVVAGPRAGSLHGAELSGGITLGASTRSFSPATNRAVASADQLDQRPLAAVTTGADDADQQVVAGWLPMPPRSHSQSVWV